MHGKLHRNAEEDGSGQRKGVGRGVEVGIKIEFTSFSSHIYSAELKRLISLQFR